MPPSRPRRVTGYARVSSAEQALGSSLDDQQAVLHKHAASLGLKIDRMYVEAATAVHEKIERREQMQALMGDLRAGDLVLVDKVDRWSRDPEFTYRSVRQLKEAGASVYFVGDACDPSTESGDRELDGRVMFAKWEHQRIKLRLVGTRNGLQARGYYAAGVAPFGYRRGTVRGPEKNVLLVHDDETAIVREMFAMCGRGKTILEIARHFDKRIDSVGKLLKSRVYLGEVRHPEGHWIAGKHPAVITHAAWTKASEGLASRRYGSVGEHGEARTADWWLRDVARCTCGGKMSAVYGARVFYFGCRLKCGRPLVERVGAELAASPLVVARLGQLRDELGKPPGVQAPKPAIDLVGRRVRLDAKRRRLVDAFADGAFDRTELRERLSALDAERSKLDALGEEPPPASPASLRAALLSVATIARLWGKAPGARRRELVKVLVAAVVLEKGEPPKFTWRPVEDLVGDVTR